jgi:hypothetical protein
MWRDVAADASRLYATGRLLTDAQSPGHSPSWRLTCRAQALWWTGGGRAVKHTSRRTQLEDGSISEDVLSHSRLDTIRRMLGKSTLGTRERWKKKWRREAIWGLRRYAGPVHVPSVP